MRFYAQQLSHPCRPPRTNMPRGRPPGSKNKQTLADATKSHGKKIAAAKVTDDALLSSPISKEANKRIRSGTLEQQQHTPSKKPRGRPPKSPKQTPTPKRGPGRPKGAKTPMKHPSGNFEALKKDVDALKELIISLEAKVKGMN